MLTGTDYEVDNETKSTKKVVKMRKSRFCTEELEHAEN